ncbi:MAG: class I SAM-dependent RNA methyltransferase [Alphaproteobacteria bacterium]
MRRERPPELFELDIDTLSPGRDGAGMHAGRAIHVPWTLPGDRVLAMSQGQGRALPERWLRRAPGRAAPSCGHYERCGGCTAQHLQPDAYAAWKAGIAREAASRAGFPDAPVAPLSISPPRARRRATLAAVLGATGVALGFHALARREIVDLDACAILAPGIAAILQDLREALRPALDRAARCDLAITLAENGLDVVVVGEVERARLAALAALPAIARLSMGTDPEGEHELVALHRRPVIRFDGDAVEPPPHVFLQATVEGEGAIRDAMRDGLDGARRVADLFSGCGTLSLPLARERQVTAVDSHGGALAALDAAARAGGVGARLRVLRRDLARRPLVGEELEDFDGVVFDPPREGARDQAAALARSPVPRVVAVSCNPATFARDAALLREGGYRLDRLTPVDQFTWSPHLELVGCFSRPRTRRRG